MKLHLPKQLFTALLAAITLVAAPAVLSIGSAAWGTELYVKSAGDFWGGNHAFTFTVTAGMLSADNANDVLAYYAGNPSKKDHNVNAYWLNYDATNRITLSAGDGHFGGTLGSGNAIVGTTAFTNQRGANFTTALTEGTTYIVKVTGAKTNQTVSLILASTGEVLETKTYNGNMNDGNASTTMITDANGSYSADGTYLWNATGDAAEFAGSNFWGAPSGFAGKNVLFSADASLAKTVTVASEQSVGSVTVYGDYTFNVESAASLSVTNGITIAAGKTLTLTADAENTAVNTIGGAVTGGSLNIAGGTWNAGVLTNATFGSAITVSGGVLEYIGSTTEEAADVPHFVTMLNSVATSGTGLIRVNGDVDFNYQNTGVEHHSVTIEDNVEVTGSLSINSHGSGGGMRSWTVNNKGTLTVGGRLWLTNMQKLVVAGGTVNAAGGIQLGHHENRGDYESRVEMSSGSLVTSGISFLGPENSVELTGGTLTFRPVSNDGNVLLQGTGGTWASGHGGTVSISGVNLVADTTGWVMDGGVLANLSVGLKNVTIAAGNTHGITLKNVTLAGSIVNNAELALGSGVTVAAGGSATVTGGKVQILNTLASAGTLNLNTDAIYVNETLLGYQTVAGTFEGGYSLDGFTLDEGGENGFQLFSGNTYYLSNDANVTTTLNKVWRDQNTCYDLVSDDSGLHFTVDSAERADSVYYINSGDVTVDSAVQSLATSYVVQGGNMKMTEGSISRAAITYTSGGITLGSDATLTNLTASSDKNLMGSVTGSGTMEVAVAANWDDTINTSADFTGTVYVVSGSRFTYDSDKLGSTLKLATGVNMQVNNGGRLDDTLVLESGNHEVHVNGANEFYVTGTISGEGTFDKRGGGSTVYIKDNASVENYRNGVGTTTVQGNAAVINLTAADGAVNVQGGTVTNLKANGGTSTLTGGSVSSLVLAGGTVNVQGGSLTDVNYNGSGGSLTFMQVDSQDTTYTLGTIGSSSFDNYSRHLTVNSGVVVNAVNLHNTWGMGTITVDGALNISEELKFSTGENKSTANNKLTGSGSVTTKKLTIGNVGKYNFSNVNLTVGDGGVAMDAATLEITSGTMTFDGKWNGTGGTVNLMGGDIFFNYASGVNVMHVLDIAGDNESTAQVSLAQDVKLQVNNNMWLAGTAAIKLAKDAELKKGSMAIIGTGSESSVTRLSTGNSNDFGHDSDDHVVNNAHVNMTSGSAAILALKLDNTAVTNAGAGELTVSNSNNSITNLAATSGNVKLTADMSVDSISAKAGKQVTVADGKTISMEGGVKIAANGGAATLAAKTDNALVRLEADTSFTIADMALTNTSIKAATVDTKVNLKNIEAENVLLAQGAFTLDATANVGTAADGETDGTLFYNAGLGVAEGSTLTLNLDVTSAVAADQLGVYDITITLSGFGDDFVVTDALLGMVKFDAESWLGKELAGASFSVNTGDASEAAVIAAAANGVPTVTYSAGTGENVGALVITISGLSIPEPTTSALSLLALAALAARRRRK